MTNTQPSSSHISLRDVFFFASVAGAALLVAVSPELAQGGTSAAFAGAVAGASLLGAGYYGVGQTGAAPKAPEPGQQ